jgi:threonine dehydratase
VPVGGGGLASGVAAAIRALAPRSKVIGVEPELAADARASLEAGRVVRWEAEQVSRTIADGTRTQAIGRLNFAHLSTQLDRIVTVSEDEIAAAVRLAAEEARLVVEPSGALSVAAMRFHAREAGLDPADGPIVGVVSGGNVDPERYLRYLTASVPPEA